MTRKGCKCVKWDSVDLQKLYWDEGKTPREIGLLWGVGSDTVWQAMRRRGIPIRTRQNPIHKREFHYKWKGGRVKEGQYVVVKLQSNDFFYPMTRKDGYVLEHRLVVAKALGRNLHNWEIVHHKNGCAKDDNRFPETLQLVQEMQHKQITKLENRIKTLEAENAKLQAQIIRNGIKTAG